MNILETHGPDGLPHGFFDVATAVYAQDPHWIPEDPAAIAAQFAPGNDYFTYGQARAFCVPGAARAVAFHEPALRIDGKPVAFFGYFESTGDLEATRAVMDRVVDWARAQGAEVLYGPIQFNTFNGYRVLLQAEPGALPFGGEPYNPPTYPALLEAVGLSMHQRYVTQRIPFQAAAFGLRMVEPIFKALESQGYRFEVPTAEAWVRSLPQLYDVADQIFSQNFAYSRLTWPQFQRAFETRLMRQVDPESSVLVTAPSGDAVAFALAYPHYGALTVQGAGEARVAAGDLEYARHWDLISQRKPRICIGKTSGVHRDHRRKGILESMVYYSFLHCQDRYDTWFGAMIREDNPSRKLYATIAEGERVYGLYARPL